MKVICYSVFVIAIVAGAVGLLYSTTPVEAYWYGMLTGGVGFGALRAAVSIR